MAAERYALINDDDNTVDNIIALDPLNLCTSNDGCNKYHPPRGHTAIPDPFYHAQVGYIWDGTNFNPPDDGEGGK